MNFLRKLYRAMILDYPVFGLLCIVIVTAFLGVYAPHFRLDASSETLTLENDESLSYYREIKERYGSDDYLIITYMPLQHNDVLTPATLLDLQQLRDDLAGLDHIASITSILDVPLTQTPPVTLQELGAEIRTLKSPYVDLTAARQELISSPLYKNLLISTDGAATSLLVMFKEDRLFQSSVKEQERLRGETPVNSAALRQAEHAFKAANKRVQQQQQNDIANIRVILDRHKDKADIHLGGVPMIAADSIDFIRSDLKTFGLGVLGLLIVLLTLFFRRAQWVILPMLTCLSVGICVTGFLGLMNWPVTIVSANFISLLLIFTLSFCIHQIVRYREYAQDLPDATQRELVGKTVKNIGAPCFFMVFTTMVAFGSLVMSDIRPIIDFGWMMAVGLGVSFIIAFTFMPAALMLLKPEPPTPRSDITNKITQFFAQISQNNGRAILAIFAGIFILSLWGMSFLSVQNRFIDYYKPHTEIYRGMEIIDNKFGGTTPLDIIIDAPQDFIDFQKEDRALMEEEGFGMIGEPSFQDGYWLSEAAMHDAKTIHHYLDSLPETGKVLSFDTGLELLTNLKDAEPLDRFYIGVINQQLPPDIRALLLEPYISDDGNQLRFSIRVYESREGLNRDTLLSSIQSYLTTKIGLAEEQVHLTGMVVLYNNVLQSLFKSQILTIGFVFLAMFAMFTLLFRSVWVALVAIIPNMTITFFVLGIMGWFGIPLDIMTITIAAICFGIADDDTIHYVHRFMEEFKKTGNYKQSVERSHKTIGRAMYYTSVAVMLGFSILTFSNFVPTFYFGVLTGISMLTALLADVMLLPVLFVWLKPLGKEKQT